MGLVVVVIMGLVILQQTGVVSWGLFLLLTGSGMILTSVGILLRRQYFLASLVGNQETYTKGQEKLARSSGWIVGIMGLVLVIMGVVTGGS